MRNPKITIRPVLSSEVEVLCEVAKATFIATYSDHNTPENMKLYVREHFNYQRMIKEVNQPDIHYFIAIKNEQIIGYTKLNEGAAQTESKFPNTLEIERIYVIPSQHKKGIGALLLQEAIRLARKKDFSQIWLGVWDQNTKAIDFYERSKFYKDGIHPFVLGEEPQRDYIMKLDL